MSRNVLAYLRFLSRTSRTLPSESRSSSASSVSGSDGAAERGVLRDCLFTGSYRELARVDSVGERRCTPLAFEFSLSEVTGPTVDLTGLELTTVAALGGGQTSGGVNDCMDVPCGMWEDATGAGPALTLGPKRKELSRGLLGPEDGEAGKGIL
jgi:hypothetical protein